MPQSEQRPRSEVKRHPLDAVLPSKGLPVLDPDIAALELSPIAYKVAIDEKWSLARINYAELRYRCFLQAIRNNPNRVIAPSKDIDTFWHHHILDTRKYMGDCEKLFGRYIHHFPYSGIRGERDAVAQQDRFVASMLIIENIASATQGHTGEEDA